jgi:hypothetical protein
LKNFCNRFSLSQTVLRRIEKNRFASNIQALLAFFVIEIENLSIKELAVFLMRDLSSLSKLAKKIEELRTWIHN